MTRLNQPRFLRLAAVLLLLTVLLSAAVQAEEAAGVLTVLLTNKDSTPAKGIDAIVYRVAATDGTLESAFAGSGVSAKALLDTEQDAKNARTLAAYAAAKHCDGTKKRTDANGQAQYPLAEGIYLVRCAEGQAVIFPSFLVRLPLELDGTLYYDVDAFPKAEPAPEPTTPRPTEPNTNPDLPQTGWNPFPALCLAIGGCLFLILGSITLMRSREDKNA